MTTFPRSPRLFKGALVSLEATQPLSNVIVFQYNPETMSRQLQVQGGSDGERSEAMRLKSAPVETITLQVDVDATDQLERGDGTAAAFGVYPQLSALESLIYPKSSLVVASSALLAAGTLEMIAPASPLTLFVWGPKRVLPVRITSFSITEEAYDNNRHAERRCRRAGRRGGFQRLSRSLTLMFDPASRYYDLETAVLTAPDGCEIPFKRRRFLPQGDGMPALVEVTVLEGDRLDQITARTLSDPEQFWRIADPNDAMDPLELTAEPGAQLRVPVPQAEALFRR